jgi:hypothetical protein
MRRLFPSLVTLILFALGVSAQEPAKRLTNKDIIDMTALGLSDDVIIAKIRSMPGTELAFDTTIVGLEQLKAAKVSDSVIKVMINPAPPAPAVVAAATPVTLDPNLPPPEVGVYWLDVHTFTMIQGQALTNAKVGGRAGSYFTYGIKSQHWDATVEGPTSRNIVKDRRPVFYFYVPDGEDASDYTLLILTKKSDRREFKIGTIGGIGGGKSGVEKDKEILFHAEHVGIRTYKITLDRDLKPGEYAFFMGTGQTSMMGAGRVNTSSGGSTAGRIYDFSIPE